MSFHVKSKDSQWLQIEICSSFLENKCITAECTFAHPPKSVEILHGKVVACYDSFKGRCTRTVCKYFHPPPHLINEMLSKGRNNLSVNNFTQEVPLTSAAVFLPLPFDLATSSFCLLPEQSGIQHTRPELTLKRSAVESNDFLFPAAMLQKRAAMQFPLANLMPQQPMLQIPVPSDDSAVIPLNASFVKYTDSNGQLLDTLPVCQDFSRNMCTRLNCKFVHLLEPKKHEIIEQRVAVCRDHANGICRRQQCKYYHIPVHVPPANEMSSSSSAN